MSDVKSSCLKSDPRKTSKDISWERVVNSILELDPRAPRGGLQAYMKAEEAPIFCYK